MPTGEVLVTRGYKGVTISHRQFVRGQGKANVSLRKGGDRRAKDASKIISNLIRDTNWEKVVLW